MAVSGIRVRLRRLRGGLAPVQRAVVIGRRRRRSATREVGRRERNEYSLDGGPSGTLRFLTGGLGRPDFCDDRGFQRSQTNISYRALRRYRFSQRPHAASVEGAGVRQENGKALVGADGTSRYSQDQAAPEIVSGLADSRHGWKSRGRLFWFRRALRLFRGGQ